MKVYHIKVTTRRHMNEYVWKEYKRQMGEQLGVNWNELEKYGLYVVENDKEEVKSIYELSVTDLKE